MTPDTRIRHKMNTRDRIKRYIQNEKKNGDEINIKDLSYNFKLSSHRSAVYILLGLHNVSSNERRSDGRIIWRKISD
jgi:hypothetical protein